MIAEQRKRLGERTAASGDLGTSVAQRIEGREALIDAHRVVARKHGHTCAQDDVFGAGGDAGQNCVWRRNGEVVAVMFADIEVVDAKFIRANGLLDDVANRLCGADRIARIVGAHVAKGV